MTRIPSMNWIPNALGWAGAPAVWLHLYCSPAFSADWPTFSHINQTAQLKKEGVDQEIPAHRGRLRT